VLCECLLVCEAGVKDALIRRFGEDGYLELEKVAEELKKEFLIIAFFQYFQNLKILYFTVVKADF